MTTITPTTIGATRVESERRWRHPDLPTDRAGAPPAGGTHPAGRLIVVGYSGSASSRAALAWLGRSGLGPDDRLLVVHATGAPVAVRNGPSAEVAERLGFPVWSTVRMAADELVGRDRVDTVVRHGSVVDVLAEQAADADLVVVGAGARRRFRRLVDALDCVVIAISEREADAVR